MATRIEWWRDWTYMRKLQALADDALSEAAEFEGVDDEEAEAIVALSPDHTKCYATYSGRWEDDFQPGEDWEIFSGDAEEIMDGIRGMFDLR